MDLALSKDDKAIIANAKAFTEQVLYPLEQECEENDGLASQTRAALRRQVKASRRAARMPRTFFA